MRTVWECTRIRVLCHVFVFALALAKHACQSSGGLSVIGLSRYRGLEDCHRAPFAVHTNVKGCSPSTRVSQSHGPERILPPRPRFCPHPLLFPVEKSGSRGRKCLRIVGAGAGGLRRVRPSPTFLPGGCAIKSICVLERGQVLFTVHLTVPMNRAAGAGCVTMPRRQYR